MLCLACSKTVALTWSRYLRSPSGRHRCPHCGTTCHLPYPSGPLMGLFVLAPAAWMGICAAALGPSMASVGLGVLVSTAMVLALDKHLDGRRELRPGPRARPQTLRFIRNMVILIFGAIVLGLGLLHHLILADVSRFTALDEKISALRAPLLADLERDTCAGYEAACERGEQGLTAEDPDLSWAHAYLAYAYAIRWGECGHDVEDQARAHLAQASAACPEHWALQEAEAYLLLFRGDPDGAEKRLAAAANSGPGQCAPPAALKGALGILQLHRGELTAAAQNLLPAVRLKPTESRQASTPRLDAARGQVLRRQGETAQAADAFGRATVAEPTHFGALLGLALLAVDAGDWDSADALVKRLQALEPSPALRQQAVARMAHAVVLAHQGRPAEADQEEAVALSLQSPSADLYLVLARRLLGAGKAEAAAQAIREAPVPAWERPGMERDYAALLVER